MNACHKMDEGANEKNYGLATGKYLLVPKTLWN